MPTAQKPRHTNLRQRLLHASRIVNNQIVKGLHERGFKALRSTHTALLSNLPLEGASLTTVATSAGMTKQAMGRLADELIQLGFIRRRQDQTDRRSVILLFTKSGLKLMQQSFDVMNEIEMRCAKQIGKANFQSLLDALADIVIELEKKD